MQSQCGRCGRCFVNIHGLSVHLRKCQHPPAEAPRRTTDPSLGRKRFGTNELLEKRRRLLDPSFPLDNAPDAALAPQRDNILQAEYQNDLLTPVQPVVAPPPAEVSTAIGHDLEGEMMEDKLSMENATVQDMALAVEELALIISNKSGAGPVNRLLNIILSPVWISKDDGPKLLRGRGSISVEGIRRAIDGEAKRSFMECGFKERHISQPGDPSSRLEMYSRSPVKVIKNMLEKASTNKKNFFFRRVEQVDRFNRRTVGHAASGTVGYEATAQVRREIMQSPEKDVFWDNKSSFVAMLQVYSDKSSMSLKTSAFSFYPLHISILNFTSTNKDKFIRAGDTVVAYLPVKSSWSSEDTLAQYVETGEPLRSVYVGGSDHVDDNPDSGLHNSELKGPEVPGERPRKRKKNKGPTTGAPPTREILREALDAALEELQNVCRRGISFVDADGIARTAHCVLASYVADTPEASCVACTIGGRCPRCSVPLQKMGTPGVKGEMRKGTDTAQLLDSFRANPSANHLRKLSQQDGISAQRPYFIDWPFSRTHKALDMYRIMRVDAMHTFPLGILKTITMLIQERLKSNTLTTSTFHDASGQCKTFSTVRLKVLRELNNLLTRIERESPAVGFHIDFSKGRPSSKLDGLFVEGGIAGMLEAKDMTQLQQVMPFVAALLDRLCGETDSAPVCRIFTAYCDLVGAIQRRDEDEKGFTDSDLRELETAICDFKIITRQAFLPFQASSFNAPKWHSLEHLVDDIRELGHVSNFSSGPYEASHLGFKEMHRSTSRRKGTALSETTTRLARSTYMRDRHTSSSAPMVQYLVSGEKAQLKSELLEENTDSSLRSPLAKEMALSLTTKGECMRIDTCVLTSYCSPKMVTSFNDIQLAVKDALGANYFHASLLTSTNTISSSGGTSLRRASELTAAQTLIASVGGSALAQKVLRLLVQKTHPHLANRILGEVTGTVPVEEDQRGVFVTEARIARGKMKFRLIKSAFIAGFQVPTLRNLHGNCVLVPKTGTRVLQKLICALHYKGRTTPLQENVMVEGPRSAAGNVLEFWFAKALLLITISSEEQGTKKEKQFVVLRYYEVVPKEAMDEVDLALGCIKLKWAKDEHGDPWVDVQPATTVRGRVHVVPAGTLLSERIIQNTITNRNITNTNASGNQGHVDGHSSSQDSDCDIEDDSAHWGAVFVDSEQWLSRRFFVNRFKTFENDKLYDLIDLPNH